MDQTHNSGLLEACRRLLDHLPGLVWIISRGNNGYRLLYHNSPPDSWFAGLLAAGEDNPASLLAALQPADRARAAELWARLRQGEAVSGELHLLGPDGEERRCVVHAFPLDGETLPPRLVGGYCHDATGCSVRLEAEKAVKESTARFRSLVEAISDLVWETDAEGRLTYVSPQIKGLLGYEPQEVLGHTFFDLSPPEERERLADFLAPLQEARRPYVFVGKTCLHKCGKAVILESSGVPILDAQGQFQGYRGLDRDITERHLAAEALFREKEKYRTLVEESPLGVAIIDPQGYYRYINSKFQEIFGYTLEDVPHGPAVVRPGLSGSGNPPSGDGMLAP
jgi:PAS domain S-box-containing protein